MSVRSHRRIGRFVAAGWCVLAATTSASCVSAVANRGSPPGGSESLRVLQMNLCDSGIATCYTGRSVGQAAAVIRAERPDIVTLNEVCRGDVSALKRALSDADHGKVTSAFEPTPEQRSSAPVRCRNGQEYGIGLVARFPPQTRHAISSGHYPAQDPADTEKRVWVCVHATNHLDACTTHLSSTSRTVAITECHYFMDNVIPAVRARYGNDPLILGGDFNLTDAGAPNAQSCIPPGFVRADDGARQDVVASGSFSVTSSKAIDMHGTTDHPGLLVDLAIAPAT
jgi:hypothetical protein